MRLADYLRAEKLTLAAFASRIEVGPMAVHRYAKAGRVPQPDVMRRIIEATDGAVTANDFFDAPRRPRSCRSSGKRHERNLHLGPPRRAQ